MEVNPMFTRAHGAPRLVTAAAALVALFALFAVPAMARHTAIDFGPSFDPTSLPDPSGQNFGVANDCSSTGTGADACLVTVINNGSTGEIQLGFSINFGPGFTNVSTLFINENGILSFGAPVVGFAPSLDAVGTPVIAPFYTELTSTDPAVDCSCVQPNVFEIL